MSFNLGRLTSRAHSNAALALDRTKIHSLNYHTVGPLTVTSNNFGNIMHVTANNANVFLSQSFISIPGGMTFIFNNTTNRITVTQNSGMTLFSPNTTNASAAALTGNMLIPPGGYVQLIVVSSNTAVVTGSVVAP